MCVSSSSSIAMSPSLMHGAFFVGVLCTRVDRDRSPTPWRSPSRATACRTRNNQLRCVSLSFSSSCFILLSLVTGKEITSVVLPGCRAVLISSGHEHPQGMTSPCESKLIVLCPESCESWRSRLASRTASGRVVWHLVLVFATGFNVLCTGKSPVVLGSRWRCVPTC